MNGNVEVCNVCVTTLVEKNIVGLEVTVHDPSRVQVVDSHSDLGNVEANKVLRHGSCPIQVESQVAAEHEVEHKEAVLIILERVPKVDNERVVNL